MESISETKNNKAEADITLNFNSYINRSNKARLNLVVSQTELFTNIFSLELCEKQSVRDDQRTQNNRHLSCLNTSRAKK